MRATIYEDGTKRIKAKIEVPMSIVDVGNYVVNAVLNNVVDLQEVQRLNKRELLHLAKEEVRHNGAYYHEAVNSDTSIIVKNYVEQMFPELK